MTAPVLALTMLLGVQTAADLPTMALPTEAGAWVIRVETSGGFTGRGTGHVTMSSAGNVACVAIRECPQRLTGDRQRSLSQLVHALPSPGVGSDSVSRSNSTCSDCVTITMTVHQRTRDGERTLQYSWDVSTAQTIPADVLRLHAAVVSLASQ
jgi:hypothetical protein